MKKSLAIVLTIAIALASFPLFLSSGVVVKAESLNETLNYTTSIDLGNSDNGTYSLTSLKPGKKYRLIITAEEALNVTVSNNKDGAVYDNNSYSYCKTKTAVALEDGTYAVDFETAAVDFDEIKISINGSCSDVKLYEQAYIELGDKTAKNQLSVGETLKLEAVLHGMTGNVKYSSSDSSVATVSDDGTLTAQGLGKTEITATVTNGNDFYEDYFELYVVNESLDNNKYGLIKDEDSSADFTLNIPSGDKLHVLQLTDTQMLNTAVLTRKDENDVTVTPGASAVMRYSTKNAFYENCEYYIDKIIEKLEKANTLPQIIILTGDNSYGMFDDNGAMLDRLISKMDTVCEQYGIYWSFVFGNHDKESDIGIENVIRKYANAKRCLYTYKNITGDSNMAIALKQNGDYAEMLYLFDTNHTGSSEYKYNRVDEYATVEKGIYPSQLNWFKSVAEDYRDVPSQVYMHIAFEEYAKTFAEHGYGVTYSDITSGKNVHAYTASDNVYGDFGELHENVSVWDDDTSNEGTIFYETLKQYNVKGVYCGHNHVNNFSVVTEDGIRLTFGTKTSTYDTYYNGILGGTVSTLSGSTNSVSHIYSVNRNQESFDVAGPYGQNSEGGLAQIKTSSMTVEWGAGFDLSLVDDETGNRAVKLTCTDNTAAKYFTVRLPEVKNGQEYIFKFNLEQSNSTTANQPHYMMTDPNNKTDIVGNASYNFTEKTVEFTFTATSDSKSSDTYNPYVQIWFWNINNGDTVTIDDLSLTEVIDYDIKTEKVGSGDYNLDGTRNNILDLIRIKKYLAGAAPAAVNAEVTGDGKITAEDMAILRTVMLGIGSAQNHIKYTDGAFDGATGDISLYSAHDIPGAYGYGWANDVTFKEIETGNGRKALIQSSGESTYDNLFVRFDIPIKAGVSYKVHFNLTANDEAQNSLTSYYWVTDSTGQIDDTITGAKRLTSSELFDENGVDITFTADSDRESFGILLDDQSSDNSIHFNFMIDSIVLESLGYATTNSVLNDDGTFEGKSGKFSLYSPTELDQSILNKDTKYASYDGAKKVNFRKETDNSGNNAMHITCTGGRWDYIYIKVAEKIVSGNKYNLSYTAKWNESVTKPSSYGYAIISDIGQYVGDPGCIVAFKSYNWCDGNVNLEFTPTADYDEFYLVLVNQNGDVDIDFTVDNLEFTSDKVENDDGTFENASGNISLYSPLDPAVTSETYSAFNPIKFSKLTNGENTVLSAKSTGTGWDAIFIKFDKAIKNGLQYTITYSADWKGETTPTTYGYSIMPTKTNWLAAESNMANFDGSVKWFDGEVSITFTANADLESWYLVLADQNGDVPLDIELDNITVETQSYLMGMCEAINEVNPEVESSLKKKYVSNVAGAFDVKSYRLWMHFDKVLTVGESNRVSVNTAAVTELHEFIKLLQEQGVERFVGMTSNYLYPNGYNATANNVIPDMNTPDYTQFLELYGECFRVLAAEFSEVDYFEPANEPDLKNGQNLCKNGYKWGGTVDENAKYIWTADESAEIVVDMMRYARAGIKSVDVNNKLVMPALCGYSSTPEYLEKLYKSVHAENGNPDDYFDILNWHPYLLGSDGVSSMDDTWVSLQKEIYAVAEKYGDGDKPVWFTEMGFTDNGDADKMTENGKDIIKMLDYITDELPFVETVFIYRVSNLTGDYAINTAENNFGLFYSINDSENSGKPKPIAIALYKWINGVNADATVLYNLDR